MKTFTFPLKTFILSIALSLGATMATEAQTFEYKDSGTDFILFDLTIPAGQNNVAYAAGSQNTQNSEGVIIKTVDGGETWNTIYPTSGTSPSFEKIEFITEDKGFAVGYDIFLKTEDGGATWTDITVGTDVYLYKSLTFFDENIGITAALLNTSPYFEMYRTTDGGETWTPTSSIDNAGSYSMAYADETTLFSVGNNELISKSTDGGDTWTQIYSGTPQLYAFSVYFKDVDNGIVAAEDGKLLTTHDSGDNWSEFATGYHNFYALKYKDDELLAGGTDEDVYFSEDNGATWNVLFNGPGTSTLYEVGLFGDGSGLICGSQGKMIKFEDVFLGTEDNQFNINELVSFYNPNAKTFNIQSNSEKIENVTIYSVTGQLLASFKNETNTFSADVSAYSNGIYLVTATSNNQTSSMKFLKQ